MQPEAPQVEVRAGFLGLFPNMQDQAHERKLKDLEYKAKEAAYAGQCGAAMQVKNIHTAREGLTLAKQLLDEADDEDIIVGPLTDMLNAMARRQVAGSEIHATRYTNWSEQRVFGKE